MEKSKANLIRFLSLILIASLAITSCGSKSQSSQYDGSIKPSEGQPAFPKLDKYWVIDTGNCFRQETIVMADKIFEQLRVDRIAEVVVICQKGIVDRGSANDEKIWAMEWGRWARLGNKEDDRAIVWLIRPDADPAKEDRVAIEVSRWLVWLTAPDYYPALEEAANYANWSDFDGALESIARNTDAILRKLWQKHQNDKKY